MGNVYRIAALMAVATAAFLVGTVSGDVDSFYVQGRVYCDTCKVQFETRISEYMHAVKVQLQCRNRTAPGEPVTVTIESETDKNGFYIIPVDGDHEDEICEVQLMESPRDDCKDLMESGRERARVVLTQNVGMVVNSRYANSLGYMIHQPLPECADVLAEIGFIPVHEHKPKGTLTAHA